MSELHGFKISKQDEAFNEKKAFGLNEWSKI
jgi:hypothetical protein